MNRLVLAAQVQEQGTTRYTPAGLPAVDLTLLSESEVVQDGHPRQVRLDIRAVAIGQQVCAQVRSLSLEARKTFIGFLAPSRNGKGLVFHITDIHD